MSITDEPLLPQGEAATALGQKSTTLTAWRHYGRGPVYVKLGRRIYYRASDLREWIDQQVVVPSARKTETAIA